MGCASSAAVPFLASKENETGVETPGLNEITSHQFNENGIEKIKNANESYVSEKMKEVVDSSAVQGVIGGVVQTKDEIVHRVKEELYQLRQLYQLRESLKFVEAGKVSSTAGKAGETSGKDVLHSSTRRYNPKNVGETITGKVNTMVGEVGGTIDSTLNKISSTVGTAEDKVKSEVKALEEGVHSLLDGGKEKVKSEVEALQDGVHSLLGGRKEAKEKMADSIKPEDIDELLDALPAGEEVADLASETAEEVDMVKEEVVSDEKTEEESKV